MPDFISSSQLVGEYRVLIRSSHEKKLWGIITLTAFAFHVEEKLSFMVEYKGVVANVSDKISLAIRAYNIE